MSDRQVIDAMVYKIRTGVSRRDLPERYGLWQTVYTRLRRYALDGVFTQALQQLQACADADGDIDWLVQTDSTIVRAHQHAAATGRKRGIHRTDESEDHALGRSRGGPTARIHLARDGKGRPLAILLTAGQRPRQHLRTPPPGTHPRPAYRPGPAWPHPDQVIADKANSSRGLRAYLRKRGIAQTIPEKTDQPRPRHNRGRRRDRPPVFDRQIYRRRNVVERCFNALKGFRGIATRYDKTATSYQAAVSLASYLFWARSV